MEDRTDLHSPTTPGHRVLGAGREWEEFFLEI